MKAQDLTKALIVFLIVMLVVQLSVFLRHKAISINPIDIEAVKEEIKQLESQNTQMREEIAHTVENIQRFETSLQEGLTDKQILQREIDYYKLMACRVDVYGEGVIVLLNDSQEPLKQGMDPNVYLIHDFDVSKILVDLRNAGAEAISINGQRVVFNRSNIQCNGPTIQINKRLFSQPYIIKAIGHRKDLKEAITRVDSYGHQLKQFGLFVEANTSVYLEIPGYHDYGLEREPSP